MDLDSLFLFCDQGVSTLDKRKRDDTSVSKEDDRQYNGRDMYVCSYEGRGKLISRMSCIGQSFPGRCLYLG